MLALGGVLSHQCLEVDGRSSIDGLEGQCCRLESDADRNRKPVEVTEEEGCHMGQFGQIENKARCSVLDMLQQFCSRGWGSSQERVAVVQAVDDRRLDWESCRCCRGQICRIGPQQ